MDAFDTAKNMNKQMEEKAPEKEPEIKYCPNCGAEMDNTEKCQNCGCLLGEIKETEEKYKAHGPKKFILKYGRILVDIETYFWFFVAGLIFLIFIIAFLNCFLPTDVFESKDWFFGNVEFAPYYLGAAILFPIILLTIVILVKYFVYLLIDIRDSLKNIEQNTRKRD